jgi:hypothetical protein
MRPAINTGSSSTGAPQLTSSSTPAPKNYALQYLEIVAALEASRCFVIELISRFETEEDIEQLKPELLGTAMAWDGFASAAVTAAVVVSWPRELRQLADNVEKALTHESTTARQLVLGYSSDSSLVAGLQGISELYTEHIPAHIAMRAQLGLPPLESC